MPKKLPKHVVKEVSRHGTVKLYFRRGKGARVRLPPDPDSAEFDLAYAKALAGVNYDQERQKPRAVFAVAC